MYAPGHVMEAKERAALLRHHGRGAPAVCCTSSPG